MYATYLSCSIGNQCCELLRAPPTLERFGASRSPLAPDLRRTIASDCPLSLSVPPPTGDVVECVLQTGWLLACANGLGPIACAQRTDLGKVTRKRGTKKSPEGRVADPTKPPKDATQQQEQERRETTTSWRVTEGEKRARSAKRGERGKPVAGDPGCLQYVLLLPAGCEPRAEEPWQNRTAPLPPRSKALPFLRKANGRLSTSRKTNDEVPQCR